MQVDICQINKSPRHLDSPMVLGLQWAPRYCIPPTLLDSPTFFMIGVLFHRCLHHIFLTFYQTGNHRLWGFLPHTDPSIGLIDAPFSCTVFVVDWLSAALHKSGVADLRVYFTRHRLTIDLIIVEYIIDKQLQECHFFCMKLTYNSDLKTI